MEVNVNYVAVLIAAAANYIIGWIWYGFVFGKTWVRLAGATDMKPTALSIGGGIISALLMSYVLAHALIFAAAYTKMSGIPAGLMCGFFNWLGFIAPVTLRERDLSKETVEPLAAGQRILSFVAARDGNDTGALVNAAGIHSTNFRFALSNLS